MEKYHYEPLPSKTSIRLLELQPGETSEQLACRLAFADVNSAAPYTALSYVWGDSSQRVPLICHGQTLDITTNLRDALEHVRHRTQGRCVWADAVCIDQNNIPERNNQVRLMAEIYKKATRVRIWLGPDEEGEAELTFADIGSLVSTLWVCRTLDGGLEQVSGVFPPALADPDLRSAGWLRISRLFRRPWFSRVWVMQEAGMASTAIAMCGEAEIDWNVIGISAMYLMRHCKHILELLQLSSEVNRIYHLYTTFLPLKPLHNFLHVLDDARPYLASDPRDKVYALLAHPSASSVGGFMRPPSTGKGFEDFRDLPFDLLSDPMDQYAARALGERPTNFPIGESVIQPDYSKSAPEVYRELALTMIERTESLEVLTAVQHDPDLASLEGDFPSWVPQWNRYNGCRMLGRFTSKHIAGANSKPIITKSGSENNLTVRGILFDTVPCHSITLRSSDFNLEPMTKPAVNPVRSIWKSSGCNNTTATYPCLPTFPRAANNFEVAYRMTLTAGKSLGELDGYDSQADFAAYWLRLYEEDIEGDNEEAMTETSKNYLEGLRKRAANGSWERFRAAAAEVCNGRKFFFSSMGFFGLGPAAMQVEDEVCVLFGADTPFIVRRSGDHFNLVGECYVHGVMQGQAVRTWRMGLFKAQDIELR